MTSRKGNSINATNAKDSTFIGHDKLEIHTAPEILAVFEYAIKNQERLLREKFSIELNADRRDRHSQNIIQQSQSRILTLEEEIEKKNRIILELKRNEDSL